MYDDTTPLSHVAAEAVVWALIADVAKERKDAARAWLADHMGADSLAVAAIAQGVTVGRASLAGGKTTLTVTDPHAFLAWVKEHHPSEILEVVNPAYKQAVTLSATNVDGTPVSPDGLVIAGCEFTAGDPYVSIRKTDEARNTVAALLAHGRISLEGVKPPAPRLDGTLAGNIHDHAGGAA
jgi:hypothetical protein